MQFCVAPQVVNRGESAIATFHLAHVILALQMRLLVPLQLELGVKRPGATLVIALQKEDVNDETDQRRRRRRSRSRRKSKKQRNYVRCFFLIIITQDC